MRNKNDFDENLISLLKVIYDVPIVIKPKLGKKPDFDFKNVITTKTNFSYPTEIKLLEDYQEQIHSHKSEIDVLKKQIEEEKKRNENVLNASSKLSEKKIEESENILELYHKINQAGRNNEIDFLMSQLNNDDFRILKFVDAALSMTTDKERIIYYLFNGSKKQRSYATLYLKRNNHFGPLQEAVHKGLIDRIQAFSR